MQNKKRLYKHLLTIYIIYFAALVIGFAASFMPGFARGWRLAQDTLVEEQSQGDHRSYYVLASLVYGVGEQTQIDGLPENVTPTVDRLNLRVTVPERITMQNAFRVIADSGWVYVLSLVTLLSYLTVFVMIALIINSLRRSIRDELPIRNANIVRTRLIGALIVVAEVSDAAMQYLNNREAARLLADTVFEVSASFPLNYWNLIVGILFLFMAEVFTIGTQLSEEQKLTI